MTVARPIWLQNLAAYTADEFRTLTDSLYRSAGVVRNAAVVSQNSPVAANVLVQPGFIVVGAKSAANGKYLTEITATEVVTITANASGNPRIDNIVMEVLDTTFSDASDIAHVIAVPGTPAGSPVAPTVLANQTLLAQVAVANGFSTIVSGNITDKRQDTSQVAMHGAGALLQSDTVTVPMTATISATQAVLFARPYTSPPIVVVGTQFTTAGALDFTAGVDAATGSPTTTGFTIRTMSTTKATITTSAKCYWIAVGT